MGYMGGAEMKNIYIKRWKTIVFMTVLLIFGVIGWSLQTVKAESTEVETFEMVGASVRFSEQGESEEDSTKGLRFIMRISEEEQSALGSSIRVKFRAARSEFYTGELTAETVDEKIKDIDVTNCYFTVNDGGTTYCEYRMYFYNIPQENFYSGVRVIGVITDEENTYVTQEIERSIGYVATRALLDVKDISDETYRYPVGEKFSRYSQEEREELETFVEKKVLSFNANNGETIPDQIVYKGEKPVMPATPEKAGFIFDGWYKDNSLFDFDDEITENTLLTAKWRLETETLIGRGDPTAIVDDYVFEKVGIGDYASTSSGAGTLLQGGEGTIFRFKNPINVDNKTMTDSLVKFQTIGINGEYNLTNLKVRLVSVDDENDWVTVEYIVREDGETYAIAYFPGCQDIGGNTHDQFPVFDEKGTSLFENERLSLQNNMFGGDAKRFFELSYRTDGVYAFYIINDNLGWWSGDSDQPGYHIVNHLDYNDILGTTYSQDVWNGLTGNVYLEFEFTGVQAGADAAVVVTEIQGASLATEN